MSPSPAVLPPPDGRSPALDSTDPTRSLRWLVYAVLMTIGTGQLVGRMLAVNSIDYLRLESRLKQEYDAKVAEAKANGEDVSQIADWNRARPFLSGNDRSRWLTMRALVEKGTYAIDDVMSVPFWDTIDMVKHPGPDGKDHFYSSKPPLLATMLAGEYCVLHQLTGWTLGDHPYELGRFILLSLHLPLMLLYFLLLAKAAERYGRTDFARVFVVAAGVFATFLTTFEIALNNHLIGAVFAMVALYAGLRIWLDGRRDWKHFFLAGLAGMFMVANELPSLAFFGLLALLLGWCSWRQTLLGFLPGAALVLAAFLGTEYAAHGTFELAYNHRHDAAKDLFTLKVDPAALKTEAAALDDKRVGAALRAEFAAHGRTLPDDPEKLEVLARGTTGDSWWLEDKQNLKMYSATRGGEALRVQLWDSWYYYVYNRGDKILASYWFDPKGLIDQGEKSVPVYAFQVLLGHHGIFSLTPIWLLTLWGIARAIIGTDRRLRGIASVVALTSLVCVAFYLSRPLQDRNYGGMAVGFRWVFWFAPLWLVTMLPALDNANGCKGKRVFCLVLLALSILSVSYPTWNPWTSPWLVNFFHYLGWTQL
ncbi:MAG TPA: hypothetical protein VFE24_17975 [Pirellulales bacterium]|jgi:hypothetical protein|nr:hypothetical protein [Pirellulales bacterium]